jgi:cytochrome c5
MRRSPTFIRRMFCPHNWVLIEKRQAVGMAKTGPEQEHVYEYRCSNCGRIKIEYRP